VIRATDFPVDLQSHPSADRWEGDEPEAAALGAMAEGPTNEAADAEATATAVAEDEPSGGADGEIEQMEDRFFADAGDEDGDETTADD
jgi:hypothetical protein